MVISKTCLWLMAFPERSHWDSTNLTRVLSGPTQGFYSRVHSDPAMCMQNPSLRTTPYQALIWSCYP